MAVVSLNKKEIQKVIGNLNDEKIDEILSSFGIPIEKITKDQIEVEVAPNRPDLLSSQGVKRAMYAFLGKKIGLKKYKINKPEKNYKVIVDSSVRDIRPYTACAIVKGINLDDEKIKELVEIQEKLHATIGRKRKKAAIGIYPLEKIKLPITFKALEPDKIKFIPLESDRVMSGLEILQQYSTGKEYANLLAGKVKFPIFIDANKNILSMPPIINSQLTGKITEKTKDVFVECSGFDFFVLSKCLNILVANLSDMGGKVYQMSIHMSHAARGKKKKEITPDFSIEKIKINLENVNKLLGLKLNEKVLEKLLGKMGYDYNKSSKTVGIPPWRHDILHEVDLIEDIAIAYGYGNFVPEIPEISTIGEEDSKEIYKRKISEVLVGLGMLEVLNYHLTNRENQFKKMSIQEKDKKFVEVENSKTDYNILRKDLIHALMNNFSKNVDSEYPQKIFEIGKVFSLENNKLIEKEHVAVALTPGNFTEIKQVLEYLFRTLDLDKKVKIQEPKTKPVSYLIDGRAAEIIFEDKRIGFIGEIHPKVLKAWKIKMPVAFFEIELEKVLERLV